MYLVHLPNPEVKSGLSFNHFLFLHCRLLDSKAVVILDFSEVESHMYEAERKGEGLFFMRTQAAIKAATVSPEQEPGERLLASERPPSQLRRRSLRGPAG